jgi:hypothetical protein
MGDYIFLDTDISNNFNTGNYENIMNRIDGSFVEISNNSYSDASYGNFVKDSYTFLSFLKNENREKITQFNQKLDELKNINTDDFNFNQVNINEIKNEVNQNNKQNSENIKIFLETYLYVILKIIFIIILFILVYNYSQISLFTISFSGVYNSFKNKISEVKTSGLEIKNRLNNKVKELKNKDPNKEPFKRGILNKLNDNSLKENNNVTNNIKTINRNILN